MTVIGFLRTDDDLDRSMSEKLFDESVIFSKKNDKFKKVVYSLYFNQLELISKETAFYL